MGPAAEKDLLPKVSREKRGTVSNEVSRELVCLSVVCYLRVYLRDGSAQTILRAATLR